MGEVYEAEHTIKGWTVAVKLMSATVSNDPVFRERMKREARTAGRLQEPHVVPIHDYGEIDGQMFLEMRLIEGTDLDTMLKRFGPLTPARAVAIITQIASALDAAHAAGVTHRDVKPPNILITRDDFAYLVDFGIAFDTADESLTRVGEAVGTWRYMAPERFTKAKATYRADVYSLACVLYECLTGSPPYNYGAGLLVSAHMMEPIPKPSAVRSGIPKAFDDVIDCGMAKKPDDRHPSAGDLALAAHEALSTPDQDRAANIVRRSAESVLPGPKVEPRTVEHRRPSYPPPAGPGPSSGRVPPPSQQPARPAWGPASGPLPAPDRPAPQSFQPNAWDRTPPGPPPPQPLVGPSGWNQPAPPPRHRNPWRLVTVVSAVIVVVILGAMGIWKATHRDEPTPPSPHASPITTTTPRTTTTTTTVTTTTSTPGAPATVPSLDAVNKLLSLLPSGYPTGTCTPQTQPMPGALVSVKCGQNTDTGGPNVSAYGLYADLDGLNNAFTKFTGTFAIQDCPGGKASPGKWWHTKDPNTVLGQVACGVYKGAEPQVMWSNQQTLVFALAGGKASGQTLDQIYTWWTSHS